MKKIIAISFALLVSTASLMAAKEPEGNGDKETKLPPGFSTLALNSTSYTTAVGIRAIGTSGITIKHFTRN